MKANRILNKIGFILTFSLIFSLNSGCDYFFQDPRLILYRPETIKIENSSGQLFSRLPLPLQSFPHSSEAAVFKSNELMEIDSLWGKDPAQAGLTELFSAQEVPYLGGDNCLNSVFFDLMGIPYSKDSESVYLSKDFYRSLQGYAKEPSNYFFYNNRLFLKESTYPQINREQFTVIGTKMMKGGANQALDQFYQSRLKEYQDIFKEGVKIYKINCDYPPRTMGRIKEDVVLHVMESDESIIFLADKHFHMVTRKDSSLRYVTDFSFSKAFFREQLHFKPN